MRNPKNSEILSLVCVILGGIYMILVGLNTVLALFSITLLWKSSGVTLGFGILSTLIILIGIVLIYSSISKLKKNEQ